MSGHVNNSSGNWLTCRVQYLDDTDPFSSTNFPEPTRPPSYTFNVDIPLCEQLAGVHRLLKAPHKIGDCTLQLSNTHTYLDLDLSISEQREEFETFHADGKRNSIIVRTQLSVRVHSCIEKLYNSKGRELRRALFSLKQIFQDDKDLVHQFVNADGLTCLIKVGAEADQNYQNYILRALGQIILYVDGMEGVIRHNDTVRWLYSLIASKFRLVVKTSLKLLLVFVEYSETNSLVLIQAVNFVDKRQRRPVWKNIMEVLGEKDGIDTELLVYAMTLINKTLSNVSDQDTFYDITDSLEEQKMDVVSQHHINKKGNDLELIEQFKIYEMALKHEDGDGDVYDPTSGESTIKWNRERTKSEYGSERKSKRRNSLTSLSSLEATPDESAFLKSVQKQPESPAPATKKIPDLTSSPKPWLQRKYIGSSSVLSSQSLADFKRNSSNPELPTRKQSVTTSYPSANLVASSGVKNEERERRRRERLAKWNEKEKRRNLLNTPETPSQQSPPVQNGHVNGVEDRPGEPPPLPTRTSTSKALERRRMEKKVRELQQQQKELEQKAQEKQEESTTLPEPVSNGDVVRKTRYRRRQHDVTAAKPPLPAVSTPQEKLSNGDISLSSKKDEAKKPFSRLDKTQEPSQQPEPVRGVPQSQLDRASDVMTTDQKLLMDILYANQAVASTQVESDEGSDEVIANGVDVPSEAPLSVKAMAEKLQGAQSDLAKRLKPPAPEPDDNKPLEPPPPPVVKKDSDIMWERLMEQGCHKDLMLEGFDFSGISELDDVDVLALSSGRSSSSVPPPPPVFGIPPPPPLLGGIPPPPPVVGIIPPPPPVSPPLQTDSSTKRKTVRLFWKEAARPPNDTIRNNSSFWSDLDQVQVEAEKFINLFQLKTKDVLPKKQQTEKRNELRILDVKRSNAINIGLTVLPPPRTIKSAIINMDEFALTKEQIEKLLTMVPTDEEISAIQEGMQLSPDVALGSAEQFLLTLSSISELEARLNLWSFKLDYEVLEKDVAEPLQDLKDGINELKSNKTLRRILATLRSIGNLLNNTSVKGFDISYLSKVPDVKDTVHKKSLLHHVTHCVMEKYPDSTDLYSELGALTRCSRVDFDVLEETLGAMENRCKNSWDCLKVIAKHESKAAFRSKLSEFLISCAQKIITLKVVHKRLINRFRSLLMYFGSSRNAAGETTIQGFARIISEFALEYRTARERVESQRKKKHQRGERNKTRGKMIMETKRFSSTEEQMNQKLMERAIRPNDIKVEKRTRSRSNRGSTKSTDSSGVTSPKCSVTSPVNEDVTDQIMEQLVKTATQAPRERSTPVSRRKRSRNAQRKSLRRTLKNGLTDEEKAVIMGNY